MPGNEEPVQRVCSGFPPGPEAPLCEPGSFPGPPESTGEILCSCFRTKQPTGQMAALKSCTLVRTAGEPNNPPPRPALPSRHTCAGDLLKTSSPRRHMVLTCWERALTRQTEKEQGESWLSFSVPQEVRPGQEGLTALLGEGLAQAEELWVLSFGLLPAGRAANSAPSCGELEGSLALGKGKWWLSEVSYP